MTSLPTSPDEADGNRGVSLISYKNEKTTFTNQPVESSSSSDSQFEDSSSLGFDTKRSMFEEKKPNFKPLKTMSPTSPTSPSGPLSPRSRKCNSEEIMEKSRQFAEMVQKPSFSMKAKNSESDEYSQETLQEFELNRRSVISMSTMKKKDVRSPTEPEKSFIQAHFEQSKDKEICFQL
ncbi:hypothetical protein LOTGIDRAFT_165882 [Lottia gigantea]|uniref:Uncharacterized protein n=1 Tax=Lottia gigantea TaxID=225164 RepID=V3ZUU8_LOTGI|nr:hypothetical protein LOTGIDRAFT_165882 [Lottia gigantea]ESO88142.1 hypothetical protein LOTGIDRAFT_165882 [Lottia gigantea]